MSTQPSAPQPLQAVNLPGMALVRRLQGAPHAGSPMWLRIAPRLCLFTLPVVWWGALLAIGRPAGDSPASMALRLHFAEVFFFAWIIAVEAFQAGRAADMNREHTGALSVMKATCSAFGVTLLLLTLLGLELPSAEACLLDGLVLFISSVVIKLSFRGIFAARRPIPQIIVATAVLRGSEMRWSVVRKDVLRHEIAGAVRLEDNGKTCPIFAGLTTAELARRLSEEKVEGVLISAPSHAVSALSRQIETSGGLGAPARFIVGSGNAQSSTGESATTDCLYLLNAAAAPAENANYRFLKRAFDICFALAALIAGAPFLLFIAIAIKLTSDGPVIFAQDRVGWNGRVFRMYKFRTMRTAARDESDMRWTVPGDGRRTAVGRLLRRYSLDEIPQFFNVLIGDMSVVGPRPERPHFVSSFRREIGEYHRRHQLKVGITGWAQVNGLRGDTCIRTRLMYDLYYLQNWGLIFDLRIILRTVLCIFEQRNAY